LRAFATLPDREVFFGDEVEARVEVLLDRARVHGAPQVIAHFAPYSMIGQVTRSESLGSGYQRRITTFSLRCLQDACVPPASARRVFRFPQVRVRAAGSPEARAVWPPLVVVSRLYGSSGLRAGALRAPDVVSGHGGRWSPRLLWSSGIFGVLGLALLGYWGWRRRDGALPQPAFETAVPARDPIEDACARVRAGLPEEGWARQRGALDRLGRTLEAAGASSLAAEARALAWRRDKPTGDEVGVLLDRVQHRHEDQSAHEAA
jgi:hypothetical protein